MRGMILAAGYGTRLWPLTADRAKPAIPFMGRPLVGYVAEYLARFGCRDLIVNLHHQSASIRRALGDGSRFGARLSYIEEPVILGTSGALDNARHFFSADETFILINGKIATDIDLDAALATHRRTGALATLVLLRNTKRERYSTVQTRDGLLQGFGAYPDVFASDNARGVEHASVVGKEGDLGGSVDAIDNVRANLEGNGFGEHISEAGFPVNPASADEVLPLMFTGIQLLEPRIFSYIPRGVFSHSTTDVYPQAIARGEKVATHLAHGMWHELSTIQRYLETSLILMRKEGREVELGEGSIIAPNADVRESVLWENVRVAAGARVRRSVLGAGVRVLPGEVIENAAVVRAELIEGTAHPEKALSGARQGTNFVVPLPQ